MSSNEDFENKGKRKRALKGKRKRKRGREEETKKNWKYVSRILEILCKLSLFIQ